MSYLRYLCLFAYIRRFCMEMTYGSCKILFSNQRTITLPLGGGGLGGGFFFFCIRYNMK